MPIKAFALLDTIPVSARTLSRNTEYNGILPTSAVGTSAKHFYKLFIDYPQIIEGGKTIAVQGFRFAVEVPSEASGTKAGRAASEPT